jgi:hypothetical protein
MISQPTRVQRLKRTGLVEVHERVVLVRKPCADAARTVGLRTKHDVNHPLRSQFAQAVDQTV